MAINSVHGVNLDSVVIRVFGTKPIMPLLQSALFGKPDDFLITNDAHPSKDGQTLLCWTNPSTGASCASNFAFPACRIVKEPVASVCCFCHL